MNVIVWKGKYSKNKSSNIFFIVQRNNAIEEKNIERWERPSLLGSWDWRLKKGFEESWGTAVNGVGAMGSQTRVRKYKGKS